MAITQSSFQSELYLTEEDKKQGFWIQDDVHLAHPLTPLFASFMVPAVTEGTKLAFANLKSPVSQFRFKLSDGRIYQDTVPYPGDLKQRLQEHQEVLKPILPVLKDYLQGFVDQEFLPFYRKLDEARTRTLSAQEARVLIEELFAFYKRAWQLHFEIVMPRIAFTSLEQMYSQLTGDSNSSVVYDLLAGVMNKSLETDRELWRLADRAKASPELTSLFAESSSAAYKERLAQSAEGQSFLTSLADVLEEYGYRSGNSHEFYDETWVENPEYALRIISSYMQKDYDFDAAFERLQEERDAKVADVLDRMPEGEGKQVFAMMHRWALDSWGLDEDHHFYIDAMLPAKSRLFLLKAGELLVAQGTVADKEDICFLYLDELLDVLSSPESYQAKVEQRKAELAELKTKAVPPFYGKPPEGPMDPVLERIFGGKPPEVQEQSFKGYAASQGVYKGTVKVVRGIDDFAKVTKGDILVCKTTTPPWTVLFTVAGAIVTDAGGILSHAATVAREYKLPAVVGTKVATSMLKDGDQVTVDGTNGVVYFGQS